MNNNVEEIKARLNIVDVVGEYVRLTKAGTNWKGLCPFHGEKSPSFMVNEEKQIFHCFGCAKGGDVFTFVQEIESLEFREVLKILAEKAGVELEQYQGQKQSTDNKKRILEALELATKFYETQLWKGLGKEKALPYLRDRGLTEQSMQKFRLGYAPGGWDNILKFLLDRGFSLDEINKTGLLVEKNNQASIVGNQSANKYYDRFRDRIMFPIADSMGSIIGYSARVTPGQDESQAKYINTPETIVYHKGKALYGIFQAKNEIKRKNYTLLVEGNMDVIASSQAGMENTVAVSGTALTLEQIAILKRYSQNLAMLFDMDSAGQKAAQKSADLCFASGINIKIVSLQDGKDAADVVQKDPQLLLDAVRASKPAMEYFLNESLKKYDKNSAEGKQEISKEVLVHVANMESNIEKSHWIKKIAHELDVEENVLDSVLKSVSSKIAGSVPNRIEITQENAASFQKRSDIIRESLVGVIMSSSSVWKEIFENHANEQWAQHPMLKFVLQKGNETNFSFDSMLASIDDEKAIEKLRKIYFETKYSFSDQGVIESSDNELRELALGYIDQYQRELQKERLHSIIKEIEIAEQSGNKDTLAKLMSEFTRLSQEIR